jgi:hypothetical protein
MIIALAGVTQIGIDNQVEDINYETSKEMFGTIFTLFYKSWLTTFHKPDLVALLLEAIGVIILFIDTSRYITICNELIKKYLDALKTVPKKFHFQIAFVYYFSAESNLLFKAFS